MAPTSTKRYTWRYARPMAALLAALFCLCSVPGGQSASVARRAMHPAFKNAGTQDGLKIWRIEVAYVYQYQEMSHDVIVPYSAQEGHCQTAYHLIADI
ncbi:hypothetical protein J6590_055852 [Homalodisca vitripennis]|nr:hypothetical protein J6590_055852 [Homalodisca vitripennis]